METTKKDVTAFVKSIGGETRYSGKEKVMYVIGSTDRDITPVVRNKFPELPFQLTQGNKRRPIRVYPGTNYIV